MSFFPDDFDPRAPVVAMLDLCLIDTSEGPARFIIGTDGVFVDVNDDQWVGSQLVSVGGLQAAIDGIAPSGSVTLSFFQDPNAPSLIQELRDQGQGYVAGRDITFLVQPIRSQSEFSAPTTAPIPWMTRTMRTLSFAANGAQDRQISVGFEAWSEDRRAARRVVLNTEGHARLIGAANPSLKFIPTDDFVKVPLF